MSCNVCSAPFPSVGARSTCPCDFTIPLDPTQPHYQQVKYVVELAKALALHPAIYRVELMTRQIKDPKVDASYGVEEECLGEGRGDLGGAYIVRLPCGPVDQYIR